MAGLEDLAARGLVSRDQFERAAGRLRSAVRPEGGRKEGIGTDVMNALGATAVRAAMAGPKAMQQVASGELDPMSPEGIAAARSIAMQTMGVQAPFPMRGAVGAGGGKLMQPRTFYQISRDYPSSRNDAFHRGADSYARGEKFMSPPEHLTKEELQAWDDGVEARMIYEAQGNR